jgi:hypothetical protein
MVGLTAITNQVPMNFAVSTVDTVWRGGRLDEAEFPMVTNEWIMLFYEL